MLLEPYLHYADPALEEKYEIAFRKPTTREVVREVGRVRREVEIMLAKLGVSEFELKPPMKGFLVHDLTLKQRAALNEALGLPYAQRNLAERENILKQPIHENRERVVHLPTYFARRNIKASFSTRPFHEACEQYAGTERIPYMRTSVAEQFADAFDALAELNMSPIIEDSWRPMEVQRGLYRRRVAGIAKNNKLWTPPEIAEVASSFTANMPGLAGHQAASALDWGIMEGKTRLDVGNTYPEGKPVSSLDFPYVTYSQWRARKIFETLMLALGFKLLKTENWHASRGDRGMSLGTQVPAPKIIYGPIKNFDRTTGKVEPYPKNEIDVPFFTPDEIGEIVEQARAA